jgi:hypothetical protein
MRRPASPLINGATSIATILVGKNSRQYGISKEFPGEDDQAECDELCDERWNVAEAIIVHQPQTIADLAWQAEAYLMADMEMLSSKPNSCTTDRLIRTFFQHIRNLGALPQPEDPLGALSIDTYDDSAAGDEVDAAA